MSDELDRRAFGAVVAGAAVTALAKDAGAQARRPADTGHPPAAGTGTMHAGLPPGGLLESPPEKTVVPLPFAPGSLAGLSERLIVSHHDNNYAAAVRKLNEIRTQLHSADPAQAGGYWSLYGSLKSAELTARNSAFLHELYFANLAAGQQPPGNLGHMIAARFESMDRFQAQFRGAAMAASGWVVLVADPSSHTLEIVSTEGHAFGAWEASPLLVLDVFEHAYAIDYGANKGEYVAAFLRNVNWNEVATRTTRAIGRTI